MRSIAVICLVTVSWLVLSCASSKKAAWMEQELRYQSEKVDKFKIGSHQAQVVFFPLENNIIKKHPRYQMLENLQEKLQVWKQYVMTATVYFIVVRDSKGQIVRYYCVKGDSPRPQYGINLKLEAVQAHSFELVDPNSQSYSRDILKSYQIPLVASYIFEHMDIFKSSENKHYVQEGLMHLGEYLQVTKYKELKSAIVPIIQEDLAGNQ